MCEHVSQSPLCIPSGKGLYRNNHVYSNAGPGFLLEDEGEPLVEHNKIERGLDHGILVQNSGKVRSVWCLAVRYLYVGRCVGM